MKSPSPGDTYPYRDVISTDGSRYVHAALSWDEGLQLFLQNRGSSVEELHVDFIEDPGSRARCLGSHMLQPGKFVVLETERSERSEPTRLSIVGGPEAITLSAPPKQRARFRFDRRAVLPVIGVVAALLVIVGLVSASIRTEKTDGPPVAAGRTGAPWRAAAAGTGLTPAPAQAEEKVSPPAHRPVPSVPPRKRAAFVKPPTISLSTVTTAFRGDVIPVAFHSNATKVLLIARIGPRKIEERVVPRGTGTILLHRIPRSSDLRVLTITAAALRGHTSSSRSATVVLLPDARDLSSYAVATHAH